MNVWYRNPSFLPTVSVDSVQRFIRHNDLKVARDPNLRDRKAYEEDAFGKIWQAGTCYLPYHHRKRPFPAGLLHHDH